MRTSASKQPFCFEVNDGELLAFAGLWERWKDPRGNWIKTCSILTTKPNAVTSVVHDRMPVILHPDNYDLWLDPGFTNVTAVSEMLKPYDARLMRCYPVSAKVSIKFRTMTQSVRRPLKWKRLHGADCSRRR